jgi:hypothetical protein
MQCDSEMMGTVGVAEINLLSESFSAACKVGEAVRFIA